MHHVFQRFFIYVPGLSTAVKLLLRRTLVLHNIVRHSICSPE